MIKNSPRHESKTCPQNGVCPYVEKLKVCLEKQQKKEQRAAKGHSNVKAPKQSSRTPGHSKADGKLSCTELLKFVQQTIKEELKKLPKENQKKRVAGYYLFYFYTFISENVSFS